MAMKISPLHAAFVVTTVQDEPPSPDLQTSFLETPSYPPIITMEPSDRATEVEYCRPVEIDKKVKEAETPTIISILIGGSHT